MTWGLVQQHRSIFDVLSYNWHRKGLAVSLGFTLLLFTITTAYRTIYTPTHIVPYMAPLVTCGSSISPTITLQLCGSSLRDTDTQGSQMVDKQACGEQGEEMMGNELADNLSLPVIVASTQEGAIKPCSGCCSRLWMKPHKLTHTSDLRRMRLKEIYWNQCTKEYNWLFFPSLRRHTYLTPSSVNKRSLHPPDIFGQWKTKRQQSSLPTLQPACPVSGTIVRTRLYSAGSWPHSTIFALCLLMPHRRRADASEMYESTHAERALQLTG